MAESRDPLFRFLFDNSPEAMFICRLTKEPRPLEFVEVNDAACLLLGCSRDELLRQSPRNIESGSDPRNLGRLFTQLQTQEQLIFETEFSGRGGEKIPVEISTHQFTWESKPMVLAIARNITERKRRERFLNTAIQFAENIVSVVDLIIIMTDRSGQIEVVNEPTERAVGFSKEELIGRPLTEILSSSRVHAAAHDKFLFHQEIGAPQINQPFEHPVSTKSGTDKHILWWSNSFTENNRSSGWVFFGLDITDRKIAEEKVQYLSMHDALTGLYNRMYFEEEMRRLEDGRHQNAGIVVCDLDGLKIINDSLGHQHGDKLLVAASGLIRRGFRTGDVVARIGGDEFAVLLPKATHELIENGCRRIREAIEEYNRLHPALPLGISLGYALRDGLTLSLADLFKEADDHMYREKQIQGPFSRERLIQAMIQRMKELDFTDAEYESRLATLVQKLAKAFRLSPEEQSRISLLIRFHDIGKVGINSALLNQTDRLTKDDWLEIRRHAEIGQRIAQLTSEMYSIATCILDHHEWWNGQGYPRGLRGTAIPIEARVLSIIDAFDVMTHDRPYRKALTLDAAIEEIKRGSGSQFDPELVEIFLGIL